MILVTCKNKEKMAKCAYCFYSKVFRISEKAIKDIESAFKHECKHIELKKVAEVWTQ